VTPEQRRLDEVCRRRGIGTSVRERIIRLNPKTKSGGSVRGWHPTRGNRYHRVFYDHVSKGEFIRRHGRDAWDSLPNGLIWRDGRRCYIERAPYLDNVWKIYAGQIPPCQIVAWYPTKKYANDRDCAVEYITGDEFLRRWVAP